MTTNRLERHYRCLSKFTDKVIVVVYSDSRQGSSQVYDVYEQYTGLGFDVFFNFIENQYQTSLILYCEFDTEDEAAMFKLRYM